MSHITGGGLPGKLRRVLPEGVDARVDTRAWEIPAVFRFLQERGPVERDEMFRVFNMGVGYVLIVRPTFAESVLRQLRRLGEDAFVMGEIVPGERRVIVE
jgi:phosphoribosylformylglycinamidine cyclo-ligase